VLFCEEFDRWTEITSALPGVGTMLDCNTFSLQASEGERNSFPAPIKKESIWKGIGGEISPDYWDAGCASFSGYQGLAPG
jgi:hypothetical protein